MKNPVTFLRLAGYAEAFSFLVLLGIAVPLKYLAGFPYGVKIVGPLHGLFFLTFCWALFDARSIMGWSLAKTAGLFISAFLPGGPFFFEKDLRKAEALVAQKIENETLS
jgi:integral membrane protein